MKTLRDYEELIRATVNKINGEDPNWTFTVKSFAKDRVRIRWSYLDYCQEKNNCFILRLGTDSDAYTLYAEDPNGHLITGYDVTENEIGAKFYQVFFEQAIESAIKNIAYYAHSRY